MPDFMVRGQVIAPVTPFDDQGRFLPDAFTEVLRWHLDCGAGGFLIAGDNGEGWALTAEELGQVTRLAKDTVAGRVPIFTGAVSITTRETIRLARVAAEAGADGLGIQPQSYVLNATREENLRRFGSVAEAVPLPQMLYNHPGRTGVNLTPDLLDEICDVAPVVALKEAGDSFLQLTEIIARFADRFAILVGPAHYIIPAIQLGAAGYVSTGPELLGKEAPRILAPEALSVVERRDLHTRMTELFKAAQYTGTRPAGIKAALGMLGLPTGIPREPVLPLNADDLARVSDALVRCRVLDDAREAAPKEAAQ